MALVSMLERGGDSSAIRQGYEGLLAEFPLCYGYWEKFARLEGREHGKEAQAQVFDRGVLAVQCVELWNMYCTAMLETVAVPEGDEAQQAQSIAAVRSVFDRALAAVGSYWGAGTLWDMAVKFEEERPEADAPKIAVLSMRAATAACDFAERYHTKLEGLFDAATADVLEALTAELPEEARAAVTGSGPRPDERVARIPRRWGWGTRTAGMGRGREAPV